MSIKIKFYFFKLFNEWVSISFIIIIIIEYCCEMTKWEPYIAIGSSRLGKFKSSKLSNVLHYWYCTPPTHV